MENIVLQKRWVQGGNVVVDDLRGTMITGEAGAHTFQISGVDSAQETVAITGTITGRFLTATNVTVPLTGSVSDGVASLTLTEDCYVIPGRFVLSVFATNGSTTQCIYCAVGNVFRTQSDIIEYPSASIPDIEQIIADAQEAVTEINAEVTAAQAAVAAAQTAVDGIEAQRQTMIASIASVAGQGTDTTLSQSGVAADAKATGDEVSALKSAIQSDESLWASVGISSSNGNVSAQTNRTATNFISRKIKSVIPLSGYKCAVFAWGINGEYIGVYTGSTFSNTGITWNENAVDLTAIDSSYQIRIVGSLVSNGAVTPADVCKNILFAADPEKLYQDLNTISTTLADYADAYINIFDGMTKRTGYYYNGLIQAINADFCAWQYIPIKGGKTYYYSNIYGLLSNIRCDYNDTTSLLTNNSGTITPTYDSFLAVTTTPSQVPLLTTSQDMYNAAEKSTKYVANKFYTKDRNVIGLVNNNMFDGANTWSGTWGNLANWTTDSEKFRGMVVKKRTNSWGGIYQAITVEQGKHYHFNAWVKVSDSKQIQVAFVNSTLGSTATVAVESLAPSTAVENISIPARSVSANKWRKINVELIALTSGTIHPLVQLTGTGATIYVAGYTFAEGRNTEKNVYTCMKDGTGDFSKVCEAVDWATMYYDSTVYVGAGEWDIVDEFGSTYMEAVQESYNNGNYLKNRIHMIFSSDSVVVANYEGSRETTMECFSPFNSGIYGFTLENINLQCANVRYCVHDERQTNSDQYTSRYINCKMKLDNSENTGTTTCQCIGGGLGTNGHIIITGGDYEGINTAHVPSTGYVPISYHNSWGEGKSRIDITGVYIHSGSIRLNWYGPSTEITECYVSGCSFTHAIVSGAETQGTSPNQNIEVIAWNNEIRQ